MPEAFHVRFRVFGLRPNTCRTTADETKPPVAREKKPLVPRVRLEVNSTGSSLRSQSERAKKAIHCFRNMWNTGWRELQRNRAIRSPHLQDHLVITTSLFFHGKRKSCLWSHVVTVYSWNSRLQNSRFFLKTSKEPTRAYLNTQKYGLFCSPLN